MGHGIDTCDKGIVWGDTWHKEPNYIRVNRPLHTDEVQELFKYDIVKVPTAVSWGNEKIQTFGPFGDVWSEKDQPKWEEVPGVYALGRPDEQKILNKCVSNSYTLLDMNRLVGYIDSQVIEPYSDTEDPITIESAGTLYNGAIQFVSMVIGRHQIHGDDSETLTRYMVSNNMRHGGKGIEQVFNTVRVVCDNTRGMAISSALYRDNAGDKYRVVKHYSDCMDKVLVNINEMWQLRKRAKIEELRMSTLSKAGNLSVNAARLILKNLFPDNIDPETGLPKVSKKGHSLGNTKKQDQIIDLWQEGQDGIDSKYQDTGYAFFNAITNVLARETGKMNSSLGTRSSVSYDNLTGSRAVVKEKALGLIEEQVGLPPFDEHTIEAYAYEVE
jgi:hypothetical protein|tara:strand:- start:3052 stop:4206 length:1155 start_codon:yes stop_codon:yes gene_type:complete